MPKNHLRLNEAERESLQVLIKKTSLSRRTYQRAAGLLALDQGQSLQKVATRLGVHDCTVAVWRDRYLQDGLALLEDKARSGRPPHISGEQRAKITALACSTPPQGRARWSLRLLAEKAVELDYVEAISHKHMADLLKKTNSNPT